MKQQYVTNQYETIKTQLFLVFLLPTFSSVSIVDFEQVNVSGECWSMLL